MDKPYLIKDNVLSPSVFDSLMNYTINNVDWKFLNTSAYPGLEVTPGEGTRSYSWVCGLMSDKDMHGEARRHNDEALVSMAMLSVVGALDNAGVEFSRVTRLRLGLHTYVGGGAPNREPHVDHLLPHNSGLLYLNDSDGSTLIYDQTHDIRSGLDSKEYWDDILSSGKVVEELVSVEPKANRLLVFEGRYYHASAHPSDHSYRMVLNFNFV